MLACGCGEHVGCGNGGHGRAWLIVGWAWECAFLCNVLCVGWAGGGFWRCDQGGWTHG